MDFRDKKFIQPDESQSGDWVERRAAYFWDDRLPHQVKFALEKLTHVLLERDPGDTDRLTYSGVSTASGTKRSVQLRFEAVTPRRPYMFQPWTDPEEYRNQFLLTVVAAAPRKWVKQENLRRDLDRAFEFWTLQLQCGSGGSGWDEALRPLYEERRMASLAAEEKAAQTVEDPAPILQVQQAILDALRNGKRLSRAHKEGGSILAHGAGGFYRDNYGEETGTLRFRTDEEMLREIRNFYDWESRRDSYPHRPPELDVWRYIEKELR